MITFVLNSFFLRPPPYLFVPYMHSCICLPNSSVIGITSWHAGIGVFTIPEMFNIHSLRQEILKKAAGAE